MTGSIELWGGLECTVNRVGNTWFNQLQCSGHGQRRTDLERIAELGIRTLRYPVLWELAAPRSLDDVDWSWADERLNGLRSLGITPIAGLVHHGSGPAYTSLVAENFAAGLANYAAQVAARFPWLEWYTPVNEPLTTARFSGLYGIWYPHGRDNRCFARALVNQCRATVLAMQAIRRVNSNAKLCQTDDLGRTYSTPALKYQADFDNARRWLSWDLLCGRIDTQHRLGKFLLASGISARELAWFAENACAPELIGINHYVTSDRFLDEHLERYPREFWGGNGRERYADVCAVRVIRESSAGWHNVLRDTWQRYRLPLALTEVHLGCTVEEQLRWLHEAWSETREARLTGIDVRAVTAWALLGSFNWNELLTCDSGHYEPGAFDVRGAQPRATALAGLIRALAKGGHLRQPVLKARGWWHQPVRHLYGVTADANLKTGSLTA